VNELIWHSANDLRALYQSGDVSPIEVVDAVLERLGEVNPAVNAFVTVTADAARAQAKAAHDALRAGDPVPALHGIPVTVKDLAETAGVRTTYGRKSMRDNVPDHDAIAWARMKAAGAIMIGKTTTPEYGLLGVTESGLTGTTATPWDPTRTSGGSSGGAAAATAAGIGPLALGSDGGGSIRVPSSCCGVVGVKPTLGRIPSRGNTDGDSTDGPLTRTVADAALMMDVIAGPHDEDRFSLPATGEQYLAAVGDPLDMTGLRIAYSADFGQGPIDPQTRTAVESALAIAERAGAIVEPVEMTLPDTLDYFLSYWGPEYIELGAELRAAGDSWPLIDTIAELASTRSLVEVSNALRTLKTEHFTQFMNVLGTHDLLITPTTPTPAFPHAGDTGGLDVVDGHPVRLPGLYFHRMTEPPSHAGLPAISIPAGFTSGGLPVGMQLIGRRFQDAFLLRAAAAFEAVNPWAQHRPLT
jgi:Asp-tRNA(Asn)/Glu-tRNA(Gln) amidotransferase A subunit family amidase